MKGKAARPKIVREPPAGYNESAIAIYQTPDGIRVDVKLDKETVWLNLNQMTTLFDRDKSVISRHLRNVFKEKELERDSVVAFFVTTAADGKKYLTDVADPETLLRLIQSVPSPKAEPIKLWLNEARP